MIAGLPYDAAVEYLESTGTQYIDTGVKFSGADDINISFSATDSSYYAAIFGAGNADGDAGASYSVYLQNRAQVVFQCTAARGAAFNYSSGARYNVSCAVSNGAMSVDGSPCGTNVLPLVSCDYNVFLFARNVAGSVDRRGKFKVYLFSITGKVDFIPVRFTNSNGQSEGAMYDRVSRKLFRNAGTGSFTIGPDVATPVMGLHFFKSQIKTAKDYVQNGLIAMWDGIENAGWGVHDDSMTTWTDLVGGVNLAKDGSPIILPDGVSSLGASGPVGYFYNSSVPSWVSSGQPVSMELVFAWNGTSDSYIACGGGCLNILSTSTGIFLTTAAGKKIEWTGNASRHSLSMSCTTADYSGVSLDSAYLDGTQKSIINGSYHYFGRNYEVYLGRGSTSLVYNGCTVFSMRIYNKAISPQDVAANYAIDKARFNLP